MLAAMGLLPEGADISTVGKGLPVLVAQSFATAQHVLVTDAESYHRPKIVRRVIVGGLGDNLFTTDGEEWLRRRQPVAPVFGVQNLDALAELMMATIESASDSWEAGKVDIQAAMTELTVRVTLRGLLGTDNQTEELATEVRRAFDEILEWIAYRLNQPASPGLAVPTPRNRRLKRSKAELKDAIHALIEHRRANGRESVDVMGQLLTAQSNGAALTDQAIVDECAGFMFAGHETTATTLTWAMYELALRPDLQNSVATEGARLGSSADGLIADIKTMATTESVMNETLRMYPAGISIARSAKRATELAGRKVRRGTLIMVPVYAIQRSPAVWSNPNDFDPTRNHEPEGGGFLPFGLGPRRCLGARFARTEIQLALGHMCARWRLSFDEPSPPKQIVAPSLRAEGALPLTITQRL